MPIVVADERAKQKLAMLYVVSPHTQMLVRRVFLKLARRGLVDGWERWVERTREAKMHEERMRLLRKARRILQLKKVDLIGHL